MAVTFVASSPTVAGANPTVAVPTGYAQGDLLVIVTTGTATPTTPTGWTQRSAQGATGFITILYKFASGTEASVALTLVGTTSNSVMIAYRGASAIDTVSGFTTATAATSVATGLTGNAFANEVEVSIFVANNVAGTWTAPALTTARTNSASITTNNGLLIVDETQAAAGNSTSRTATITGSHTLSAVAFSIIPSGRYWVGGSGTWDQSASTNWSFTSGGASGAPAPTAVDNVFFDQATTYTVTLSSAPLCFGMTVSAGAVTYTSTGALTVSGSMSLLAGTVWSATGLLTFNATSTGRTITTNATTINGSITFNGVGGVWSLGSALTTGVTLTTTLTNGSLLLNGFDLTTGIFSSNNANTRTITFGSNNIILSHTTAAQTVLSMATVTGLTLTGTGGFASDASVTRTYVFGTTGGTIANSPNLTLTGSGTAVGTFTTGSWFNTLSFGTTAFTVAATSLNLNGLTLSSGGTFSSLTVNIVGTGTLTSNTNTTLASFQINTTSGTTTLGDNFVLGSGNTLTFASGTLVLNGFNLTVGIFSSSNATTRSINFGSTNIILATPFSASTVLDMSTATGFTWSGTGGFLSDASVTRTYQFGITGGTVTNAPNLSLTGSGTQVGTFTTGSWFKTLSFGTTAFNPGTTALNIVSGFTLSSGGTFTNLTPTLLGSGTITSNTNTTLAFLAINCVGGTTTLGDTFTLTATSTVNLINGTINLNGFNLTTGIFSSSTGAARGVTFGSNFIYLIHSTAGTNVLLMANSASFAPTGSGGFSTAMTVTRTFSFGSTGGGTTTSAPNLFITSGSSVPTFTTASWFNNLDFTGSSTTPAATVLNITGSLTLSTGGIYTSLGITMVNTGTITPTSKTIAAFTVNTPGTVTFAGALGVTTYTQTTGTINFATNNLTCSAGASYAAGTLNNIGTISCTTWAETGTFTLSSGTISASTSYTVTSGSFTYSGGTITTPSFVHTAGTVTLTQPLTLTGSYTLTTGTLTITNLTLTCTGFLTTGTGTRSIVFGTTGQIILTGNNITIWDGGSSGITLTGTPTIVSNYAGSVGTRTINVGTGWTESTDFDVKVGSAVGISIGSGGTDTVAIAGIISTLDLTGMTFTFSSGVMTVYGSYTIPATGGSVSASANLTTFTSTQVTPVVITVSRTIDFPITFNGAGGTFNLGDNLTIGATRSMVLTNGSLNLNGFNLTTGIFNSGGTNTRVITFGSNFIYLVHTTANQSVLNIAYSNLSWTGTGGFSTAMTVTRTFSAGTTPTSTSAGVNLFITSGSAAITFTAGDWYSILDFTGCTSTASVSPSSVNVNKLILDPGGTYSSLSITTYGTGTLTTNGKTIGQLLIGNSSYSLVPTVTTLAGPISCSGSASTQTSGATPTLNFASYDLTSASTFTLNSGGILTNIGTITCTTFNVTAASFTFTQGTITATVGFIVQSSSSFTYTSGTLSPTPAFTQTLGTVTLNKALALTTTGTYTLTQGTLTLNSNLTTGAFIATGTSTRSIAFNTNQITLTGNNATIWDGGSTGITYTGTPTIVSNYTGSVGTRSINVGAVWTEATAFDVKVGSAVGISIGSGATDTVSVGGILLNFDLTGMTFTYTTGAMTVYGNYTIPATGGSLTSSASTVTFASTNVTPRVLTVSRTIQFAITFNGVGGTFNLGDNLTTGATITTTLTSGTLALNGYNYSTGLFSSAGALARTIAFGSNTITVSGLGTVWDTGTITNLTITGTAVVNVTNATAGSTTVNSGALSEANSISFNFSAGTYALTFLGTAGYTADNVNFTGFAGTLNATAACTVYGSYIVSSGMTVTASANTLTFGRTSGTSIITASTKTLPPVTFNGVGGTFNLGSNLTTSGLFQVLAGTFSTTTSNYSITCTQFDSSTNTNVRSISFNGSTVTISGTAGLTLDNTNLTFNAGTSQITLSNSTSTLINTIGGGTLYNVSFTGGGTVTLPTVNTYNNLTFTNGSTTPSVVTVTSTQTINGAFSSVSANASTRLTVQSATDGVQVTISAGSVSLTDVDFQDIYASGASIPWTGTRLGNLGNNTNITFSAGTTKYWSLVAGGNWNAIAWATSSGGTPSANNFPLPQDTCIIQNTGLNTSATITINSNWSIGTIDMSTRTNAMTLAIGTTLPNIFGNWINGSGVTITGTGTVNFIGQDAVQTITGSGVTFTPNISVNTIAQTVRLGSALTLGATSTFTLTSGILSLNGYNLTTGILSSSNTNTRSIVFGANNIILAHTTAAQTVLNMATATGFTYTSSGTFGSATGCFQSTMSVTRTFTFGTTGGTSTNAPALYLVSGASVPTITTGSYYNEINFGTTAFTLAATTQNLNSLYSVSSTSVLTALTVNVVGTGSINSSLTLGPVTLLAGTTTIVNTLTCSTFTINGTTFNFTSGTITPTTSFTITSGTFTYGGTATLSAVPTFTQTAGNVTFSKAYALTATGAYTLISGTLTLTGNLTVGTFSSNNNNNRVIVFGSNNIILATTTAAATNLDMANTTGFSYTGTGGFVSGMSVARTFNCATVASISGSISFNGGSQYLTIPSSSSFQCGTGAFTIEAWVYPNGGTGTFIGSWQQLVVPGDHGIQFSYQSSGNFQFYYNQQNSISVLITSANTYSTGAWYHVAIVRIGNTFTLYVNGVSAGSSSFGGAGLVETQFWVGVTNPSYQPSWFNGLVSNVRIVKGLGVYTGNFTVPTSPLTVTQSASTNISAITGTQTSVLLNTPNNAAYLADTSTNNFTVTASNGAASNASTPITVLPAAGTPPNLSINSGASIPTVTSGSTFNILDFTGSTCTPATTTVLVINGLTLATGGTYTGLSITSTGSTSITGNSKTIAAFLVYYNGNPTINDTLTCTTLTVNGSTFNFTSGTLTPTTSITITTGTFTYGGTATLSAVPTFTQTAGNVTLKAYSLTATGTYTLTSGTLTLTGNLTTGIFSSNNSNNRTIFFDVNNIILSTTTAATNVLDMANATNFLYTGTGGFVSGMSVTRSFTVGTTGSVSGSISFNGSNQYLSTPNSSAFQFGTGAFTIEAWVYPNGGTGTFIGSWIQLVVPGDHGIQFSYQSSGRFQFYYNQQNGTSLTIASANTYSTGAWYHVAIVRIGNTFTLYVNGISAGSSSFGGAGFVETQFYVGVTNPGYQPSWFNGLVSNVRFVQGLGVYTGNFTPSPSPLTATQSASTNISAITGTQTLLLLNTPNNGSFLTDTSVNNFTVTASNGAASNASTPITVLPAAGAAPNLTINSGASIPSITSGSTFNILDFTGSTCTPATATVNLISNLVLATGGTYTALSASMNGSGTNTITGNSKTMAALTFTNGINIIADTLTCTTFTINGTTFNFTSGTLNPTTSFTLTSGAFTYSGTATLGSVPTFTQTAGTVTFSKAYALAATGTYTLTSGNLLLGANLTTGIFSSNNTNIRSISFDINNIILSHTTAATTVLDMANETNFSYTGTGGFTSGMSVTRTFNSGTSPAVSGSILYNTTNQRLSLAASSAFDLSGGTWTIEFWMRSTATPSAGNVCRIFMFGVNSTSTGFAIGYANDGSISGGVPQGGGTGFTSAAGVVSLNTWYHVAVVSNAGIVAVYINGAQSGSSTTITQPTTSSPTLFIGYDTAATVSFQYQGYLSNIRIVKSIAVYTGNFIVPISPLNAIQTAGANISAINGTQTSLLLNTPNNGFFLTDGSTNNFTVTNNGSIVANILTPITVLPAAGQPVNLAINSGASVPTLTTGGYYNILDFTGSSTTPATTTLNIASALTLSSGGTYTGLTVNTTGATTISGINKTIAALSTTNGTSTTTIDSTGLVVTGAVTMPQGQLLLNGNLTSSSFAIAGSSRTLTGTNATYSITGSGTSAWTYSPTGSVSLVGTSSQYLSIPANNAFNFGTGEFTMECWVYPITYVSNATTASETIDFFTNASGSFILGQCQLQINSTGTIGFYYAINTTTGTANIATASTIPLNAWTHLAVVRVGTTISIYINGVSSASATVSQAMGTTGTGSIGRQTNGTTAANSYYFNGYISNVRVVKGVGVYTGNFTVPTGPFSATQSANPYGGSNTTAITSTQTSLLLNAQNYYNYTTDSSTYNIAITNVGSTYSPISPAFTTGSPSITCTGIIINMSSATAKTFVGGGGNYSVLNQGGAGILSITGTNTFDNITNSVQPATVTFPSSITTTVRTFGLSGVAGSLLTINSSSAGTAATLSKSSGIVYGNYLSIQDSTATGGATWYAGPTSTSVSNNTGWIFTQLPIITMGNLTVADGGFTVSNLPV